MSKHTKGPWTAERGYDDQGQIHPTLHTIWSEGTLLIARTCFAPASEANARLIAAAPELLEACKRLLAIVCSDSKFVCSAVELAAREAMCVAIKKAEGAE